MQRSVSCLFDAELTGVADVVLSVAVADGTDLASESMLVTLDAAPVEAREVIDANGTRLHLVDRLGPGRLAVSYQAEVAGPSQPALVTDLDRVRYTRPSRYCESDELSAFARAEFRGKEGLELVDAVTTWVATRTAYTVGSSRPTDGAVATLLAGQGVCRDFAHLVIGLLRGCDHPARLASVYAPGLSPMDFHAVVEAAVGDEWLVVDATRLAPREALVRIATGRDAADTAFLTSTGDPVNMGWLTVMAVADPDLPIDDTSQVARLS